MKWKLALCLLLGLFFGNAKAEPGWSPTIVATGTERVQIEATPILLRPYRPFHFYGNAVRRRHYRGSALPNRSDVATTLRLALRRF